MYSPIMWVAHIGMLVIQLCYLWSIHVIHRELQQLTALITA